MLKVVLCCLHFCPNLDAVCNVDQGGLARSNEASYTEANRFSGHVHQSTPTSQCFADEIDLRPYHGAVLDIHHSRVSVGWRLCQRKRAGTHLDGLVGTLL